MFGKLVKISAFVCQWGLVFSSEINQLINWNFNCKFELIQVSAMVNKLIEKHKKHQQWNTWRLIYKIDKTSTQHFALLHCLSFVSESKGKTVVSDVRVFFPVSIPQSHFSASCSEQLHYNQDYTIGCFWSL